MEAYTSDVVCMTFKGQNGIWVRRLDVVQFNLVMPCRSKVAFIWGDTQAIDLRICVLNSSRADPGECFPEPIDHSVVSSTSISSVAAAGDGGTSLIV